MPKYEVYATLLVLAIIFTTIDLVVSSFQLAIPSLIFSSITMIIGFIGAYLSKTIQVEKQYENAVTYIKKNFGTANTILSILDVISCILAFLTGIFVIMLIFRIAIALRIAIYINKYRSVAFAVLGVAYMHFFKNVKRRKKMTQNTILQNILVTILGVFGAGGIVVGLLPEWAGIADTVTKYVAVVSETIAFVSGVWLGLTHDKVVTAEDLKKAEAEKTEKKAIKEAKALLKNEQTQELSQEEKDKKAKFDALVQEKLAELKSKTNQNN